MKAIAEFPLANTALNTDSIVYGKVMEADVVISAEMAPQIDKDSWLMDPAYDQFRRAYAYASTQSAAIPGLANLSPEQAYHVYQALERGIRH